MRTNVLGALLVTSILFFSSVAFAVHFGPIDTIDVTPGVNECTVTGFDPLDPKGEGDVIAVTATGGVAIVRMGGLRGFLSAKCNIRGLSDDIIFVPNPDVGFLCIVAAAGIGEVTLDPAEGATTKKRISKSGKVQLECSR